ncbi:MAG TPA: tetratricopeptide repeat protein, partial [Chitinophagaceae bacterium]|nr:tetratricopeptide repeat protein [Chitinophagaceae bacterium]
MRILIFLLLISFIIQPTFSQTPSKKEIQEQMLSAINELKAQIADVEKQLAEAKKNKDDAETIKDLEDQLKMLRKQVDMMGGLNKNVSKLSNKTIQQATEEETTTIPKRDITRINSLPKKNLTEAELSLFITKVHAGVEKLIPATERTEALKIYNETKSKYKSTAIVANAANGCWMVGHWEKALFIMGKVCIDDITDADNLNNYAAFLIMTGGEQAAIPILQYLNEKYPGNSTILNNLGQAWFGLGDMENAKKFLTTATDLYPNHSMANLCMSQLYANGPQPDVQKSISCLKASLKENYDPEKEVELSKLGYQVKFADLPPLNYPMSDDPLGFIPLINSWDPNLIQSSIEDEASALALQRYVNGVEDFKEELVKESVELNKKFEEREKKLSIDKTYNQEFLEPYDCPAYLLAGRSIQLYCIEKAGSCFNQKKIPPPLSTAMWFPFPHLYVGLDEFFSLTDLYRSAQKFWMSSVTEPLAALGSAMALEGGYGKEINCKDYDAKMNAYLAKRKEIYRKGVIGIRDMFVKKSPQLRNYIKYQLYGAIDAPPKLVSNGSLAWALVNPDEGIIQRRRLRDEWYELILGVIEESKKFEERYTSYCIDRPNEQPQGFVDLKKYKVETVKCEYIKKVDVNDYYTFELKCNTSEEKSKLKKRKADVQKGSAESSKPNINQILGPLKAIFRRGPNNFFDEED